MITLPQVVRADLSEPVKFYPVRWFAYWTLLLTLSLGMVSDLASNALKYYGSPFWRVSLITRGISMVAAAVLVAIAYRGLKNRVHLVVMTVLCVFSLAALWLGYRANPLFDLESYVNSSVTVVRLFYFIALCSVAQLVMTDDRNRDRLALVVDYVLGLYSFFIILGAVSGLDLLGNHWSTGRPGSKGIIISQNEATGFIMISVAWYFLRYKVGRLHGAWVVLPIAAGLLVGNKGIYLGLPLLLLLLYCTNGSLKEGFLRLLYIAGGLMLATGALYFVNDTLGSIARFFYETFSGVDSFSEFIAFLMNGREVLAVKEYTLVTEHLPWAFVVGGYPIRGSFSGMDLIDITFLFGVPFLVTYLWFYARVFFATWSSGGVARFHLLSFFLLWMLLASLAGHLLFSALIAPFLALYVSYANAMADQHAWRDPA